VANDTTADPEAYAEATAYLADTLEWLSLWEDNARGAEILDETCEVVQDRFIPQP